MITKRLFRQWQKISSLGSQGLPLSAAKRVILVNKICIILGLTSFVFIFPWALQANAYMVLNNVLLILVYSAVIWMNKTRLYSIPKYLLIFFVSTPVFVVSGMVGLASHLHFSLIPIAGFSILLFDRREKLKIFFAMAYPTLLLSILVAFDFTLFPNLVGDKLEMLPAYDYMLNFTIIIATMVCFYRAYIRAEDNYQILYEEHLEAQYQLDEERAKAIYAAKMVSLGEMAGGIAHEINTPLAIIKAYAERLHSGLKKNTITEDRMIEHTNLISQTCTQMAGIVKALSSISRSSHDDPLQEIDLHEVIQETLIICQHRYYLKSIKIEVDCAKDLPKVLCRPVEIGQVLINLLNNAYDAVAETPVPKVNIIVRIDGNKIVVSVEDNGPGIPPSITERIFDTFYTTKGVGKGTGLGLSISKKLIEANHGRLWVESKQGLTSFKFEVPVVTTGYVDF